MEDTRLSEDGMRVEKRVPKDIAIITVCGAFSIRVNDMMQWKQPTPEQIKNLRDLFCIDVEILE